MALSGRRHSLFFAPELTCDIFAFIVLSFQNSCGIVFVSVLPLDLEDDRGVVVCQGAVVLGLGRRDEFRSRKL